MAGDSTEVRYRVFVRCLLGILGATLIMSGGALGGAATNVNEYDNIDYAYAVSLPEELHYFTSAPPNPNRGFGINVPGSGYVRVDASSTDDSTLSEATKSESDMLADDGCTNKH